MGSLKITLCAGFAVAAAVAVPTAYASVGDRGGGDHDGSVSVLPATPVPGAEVAIEAGGCTASTATAVSAAFVADARLVGTGGTLVGETRVRSSIEAGGYDVRITCADHEVKGRIEVVEPADRPARAYDDPYAPYAPAAPASPVAPVHAGGGGTAALAAGEDPADETDDADDARVAGPGTAQAVTGLILAGVAAGVVIHRGVRRGRSAGPGATGSRAG